MDYQIDYFSEEVQGEILALPDTLAARYIVLTRRMEALGPNLGEPHTKAFGHGLFELRLKGAEGIARVFYCTVVGKRIYMLHCFAVRAEVERIEREEGELLDAFLKARHDAGLSQAQVAERMGTHAPAIARLERSLATGKHSPSLATLRKYADACGKQLVLRVA